MASRRQFVVVALTSLGLAPIVAFFGDGTTANGAEPKKRFPIEKTKDEWKKALTPRQYRVLREGWTEPAGSSPLDREKRAGVFACAGCAQPLYSSATKFDSGTGWPSFFAPLDNAVETSVDRSFFMVRPEVHCSRCGGHLGHVFPDGPKPTGLRFCMNGAALTFTASPTP